MFAGNCCKNSYNRLIREALRFESRLSLNSGKSDDVSEDNSTRVPIRLDMGYPEAIEGFFIPKKYDFAAMLSRIRPDLVKLKESSDIVASFICEHQEIAEISEFVGGGICYAESEAKKLLELVDEYDLVRELLNVNNNILGCYRFSSSQQYSGFPNSTSREILLYWGIIGIIAPRLGVRVEALSAVVLAHELSHAYSHVGYDIDGNRWNDECFESSEIAVIEGLAQYYAERVLSRLTYKIPGAWDAYNRLLERQNESYLAHKIWINEIKATPEAVRETLIRVRNTRGMSLIDFNDLLYQTNVRKYSLLV